MKYSKRSFIVIKAEDQKAANNALERRGYGPSTFSVPRIPETRGNGEPPASHYICNIALTENQRNEVESVLTNAGVTFRFYDRTDPDPAKGRPNLKSVEESHGIKKITREE